MTATKRPMTFASTHAAKSGGWQAAVRPAFTVGGIVIPPGRPPSRT
jgi:hypothetical protein